MLTYVEFTEQLRELNELNSQIVYEENRILNCGLKKFDFQAASSRLKCLIDSASKMHLEMCRHLDQKNGRESIGVAVNYIATLIMTANEMMEIADRLDGKTKGIKFGFLQYRKKLKGYNQLCSERHSTASKLEKVQTQTWKIDTLKYMPQDVFNLCAVTAAKVTGFTGKSIEQVSQEITSGYIHTFSDQNLSKEVAEAASSIREYIREYFVGTDEVRKLTHLQYCIDNYDVEGQLRQKSFLSGTSFKHETNEIKFKPHVCSCNIANLILRIEDQTIPNPPDGWTL
jgi:hypothetical protein